MSENKDFENAITAIRAGDNAAGQRLLIAILKKDPKNELAWLWLSRALPSIEQRIAALEQCLKVNPNSDTARRALGQLRKGVSDSKSGTSSEEVVVLPSRTPPPSPMSPVIAPPSRTPLKDRLIGGENRTSRMPSTGKIGFLTPAQVNPAGQAVGKSTQSGRRPRRPRSFGALEMGLLLLVIVAMSLLAYIYFYRNPNTQFDLASQSKQSTKAALETGNAALRIEISDRQTQTALPANTLAVTPNVSATPQPSQTPTRTSTSTPTQPPLPAWIAPENVGALVVQPGLEGEFFNDLEFSLDGLYLAAASSNAISVWDTESMAIVHKVDLETRASALAFSPAGNLLFYTQSGQGNESFLNSLSIGDWQQVLSGVRSANPIAQLRFSRDPDILIMALLAVNSNVNFFSISKNLLQASVEHPEGVIVVDVNPITGLLATGGYDDTVHIWEPVSHQAVTDLSGHSSDVTALVYSSDGELLASGSQDGEIRLWDASSWRLIGRFQAHEANVVRLVFSKDNRLLISGGGDDQLIAWDMDTYEAVASFPAPVGLTDLAISPSGEVLAASGEAVISISVLPEP